MTRNIGSVLFGDAEAETVEATAVSFQKRKQKRN